MELCNVSGNAWHLSWQVLLDPGTQGRMRLEAKGSYNLVAAAWMRISLWDKVVGRVFPFQPSHQPSGKSRWGKTKALCETSQWLTLEAAYVTVIHPF